MGTQNHFSECVAAVLSVHSLAVPVDCSLIMARSHSGSAPLLSPPGCPSVHLRDRLCGLAAADHSLMISKKQLWIHFSHSHSRLKAIFQTADSSPCLFSLFFVAIFSPPSFCVRHFPRKEIFHCTSFLSFFFLPKRINIL